MKNYKTAPFDLEKALAGHMLVDGEGEIYTNFRDNPYSIAYPYRACKPNGKEESFTNKGLYTVNEVCEKDLLLYIPITDKELALQALNEATTLCQAVVNGDDLVSCHIFETLMGLSNYINSLPEPTDICTKIKAHEAANQSK